MAAYQAQIGLPADRLRKASKRIACASREVAKKKQR
jgi:hypothetical protein